jgi:hypothetical protein
VSAQVSLKSPFVRILLSARKRDGGVKKLPADIFLFFQKTFFSFFPKSIKLNWCRWMNGTRNETADGTHLEKKASCSTGSNRRMPV